MNLTNLGDLPQLAKVFYCYTKYLKLSSNIYSKERYKTFQNEINFKNLNFEIFKGFLIVTELGKSA